MNELKMRDCSINIIGEEKCTGCFGCYNACPYSAIDMKLSAEGFFIPEVIEDRCIKCGICSKNCPVINYESDNFTREGIKVYAAYSGDDKKRLDSSSGGIFSEIAEYLLEKSYIIYGVAWNKQFGVEHIRVENKSELYKLRSSKYVQSNIGKVYSEIADLINNQGKKVLFSGTPCQAAAIKGYIHSDNLYVIDVLCHGIPSKIVFDEYIKYIGNGSGLEQYTFRDKSLGWSKYMVKARFKDNTTYNCITKEDPFFHGFICDLYSNRACYDCKFSTLPRVGDITLGDFWKVPEELMDERGVSAILGNNKKGLEIIKEVRGSGRIKLIPQTLDTAVKGNPRIHDGHLNMRLKRDEILSTIKQKGFKPIMENYINKTDRYIPDISVEK